MIRDLLLLMRAPLAAGAVANMGLGLILAWDPSTEWPGWLTLGLLALATCCFYWGGMVLNDWFDRQRDRTLAPHRPLPAGRIGPGLAVALGFGLLALGLGFSAGGSALAGVEVGRGLVGGALVAGSVLLYDGWLKRYRVVGSLAMASCRFTNVLLPAIALGLDPLLALPYALLLGVYVFNLTVLSTYETEDAPAVPLAGSFLGLLAVPLGVGALALGTGGAALTALLPAGVLLVLVLLLLFRSIELGTRARGGKQTIALLKAIWWLDLGVLLTAGVWPALAGWVSLYVLGSFSAKALFAPPPR